MKTNKAYGDKQMQNEQQAEVFQRIKFEQIEFLRCNWLL